MCSNILRIGLLASLLCVGSGDLASAQPAGQVLPELSGRRIGPKDDPRQRRRVRQHRARKRGAYSEVRRRRRPQYRSVRLKGGGWRFYGAGWSADVGSDGSLTFDKRSATWSTRKMQMTFDLTDAVMRSKKKDPYAAAKLRFMAATAPWRRTLRRAARRQARKAYFAHLPGRLRALWKRNDISTLRKRALLFRLWEECLEPGRTTDSVLAQQGRWMILRFIRKHLPRSGPKAFTRRELAWMGKRRKRRDLPRFDPYGQLKRPVLLRQIDTPM